MKSSPVVGIVGEAGAYGRWLRQFFEQRMHLRVIGRDPALDAALSERELIEQADVLVFSLPIRHTTTVIESYVSIADGIEQDCLWLDVTSIKKAPVEVMLQSRAEVVGLHPMCAPPKTSTMKGFTMAVCEARLDDWRPWVREFLAASEAACSFTDPGNHDRAMALVQGMVHAAHLAQIAVRREWASEGVDGLHPFRTVGYMLDDIVSRRILAGNPAIYQDIQFENPHVAPMLRRYIACLDELRRLVESGDDAARERMREVLLDAGAGFCGRDALAAGSLAFEQLGYLLADMDEPRFLSVFLPEDQPGSLRALLSVFERQGINLDSIHSSRNATGELHFRIGIGAGVDGEDLQEAARAIEAKGIGRVIARGD